jgi:hypothetical protein
MVRIDSFYVGRDNYGNGHYAKVKLVDGNTYFLKYLGYDEYWCSHFYRWPNLIKPPYHFLLTRKKHYDSMKDTSDKEVRDFLLRLEKEVFYNQFNLGADYTMKNNTIEFTEFSQVIELLRLSENPGQQSIFQFDVKDE